MFWNLRDIARCILSYFVFHGFVFFFIYINRMLFSKNPTTTPQLFWYLLTIQQTEETLIHYITPYQPGLRLVISGICAEVVLLQS